MAILGTSEFLPASIQENLHGLHWVVGLGKFRGQKPYTNTWPGCRFRPSCRRGSAEAFERLR